MGFRDKMVEELMEQIITKMGPQDRERLISQMMEKLTQDMTVEDKLSMTEGILGGIIGKMVRTAGSASSSTTELNTLFEDWLTQIEDELAEKINTGGISDPETLASEFQIGKDSIHYLINRLARAGRITVSVGSRS